MLTAPSISELSPPKEVLYAERRVRHMLLHTRC